MGETTEHLRGDTVGFDPAGTVPLLKKNRLMRTVTAESANCSEKSNSRLPALMLATTAIATKTGRSLLAWAVFAGSATASLSLEAQQRRELKQKCLAIKRRAVRRDRA